MKPIQAALVPTDGYIKSFTRNTVEGWWELEVGLPKNWVYDENIKVGCEVVFENEVGKLVKIFPKKTDVVIDDLITFVEVIIKTNERIAEKEKQFTDKMQEMKSNLEKEAIQFLRDTIQEVAGKLQMRNRSTKLESQEAVVLVHERCDLYARTGAKWVFYSKFRATTFLQEKKDGTSGPINCS